MNYDELKKEVKLYNSKRLNLDTIREPFDYIESCKYVSFFEWMLSNVKYKMNKEGVFGMNDCKEVSETELDLLFKARRQVAEENQIRFNEMLKLKIGELKELASLSRLDYEYAKEEGIPEHLLSEEGKRDQRFVREIDMKANKRLLDDVVKICFDRLLSGEYSEADVADFPAVILRGIKNKKEEKYHLDNQEKNINVD